MNLFINYYKATDTIRQGELDTCLMNNYANQYISKVFVICDGKVINNPVLKHPKVEVILFGNRPTFTDFFRMIGTRVENDSPNCIANADVFFNQSLVHLSKIRQGECWAMSRWDYVGGKLVHVNRRDSQDAWIFPGFPVIEADFHLGIPGCDNRIAWEFQNKGWKMVNPSLTVQMIHLHKTQERPYFDSKNKVIKRIGQPYHFVNASKI